MRLSDIKLCGRPMKTVSYILQGYQIVTVVFLAHLQEDSLHGSRGRIGQRVMTGCCPATLQAYTVAAACTLMFFQGSVERPIRYLMADAIMQINLGCKFLRQVAEADLEQPALHLHSKGSIFTAIIPAQDVREPRCSSCGGPHSLAVHSARCAATQAGTRSALVQSGGGERHPCTTL